MGHTNFYLLLLCCYVLFIFLLFYLFIVLHRNSLNCLIITHSLNNNLLESLAGVDTLIRRRLCLGVDNIVTEASSLDFEVEGTASQNRSDIDLLCCTVTCSTAISLLAVEQTKK